MTYFDVLQTPELSCFLVMILNIWQFWFRTLNALCHVLDGHVDVDSEHVVGDEADEDKDGNMHPPDCGDNGGDNDGDEDDAKCCICICYMVGMEGWQRCIWQRTSFKH